MQTIRPKIWERMRALYQVEGNIPNYLVELRDDDGKWITIPKHFVSQIDIDNATDFSASQCDIKLANEGGRFTDGKKGADSLWKTLWKDEFDWDSSANYIKLEGFRWNKDVDGKYSETNSEKDTAYNGYMRATGKNNGAVSEISLSYNASTPKQRLTFDFRKKSSKGMPLGELFFYDDFTKGMRPEYSFEHTPNADDWDIRSYRPYGGKEMMSSGYIYAEGDRSILHLNLNIPCRCILEYKHRIYYPPNMQGWAFRLHRLLANGVMPQVPPKPVLIPGYNSLDYQNGGIEFHGDHSGVGASYERHQHILEPGPVDLAFNTWYKDGRTLSRWEMDYIKIFSYGESSSGGNILELLVDDKIVATWNGEVNYEDFVRGCEGWFYINGTGRHKITWRTTHAGYSVKDFIDIDNILVQEEIPGDDDGLEEFYGYLIVPNVMIRVWLGYGIDDGTTNTYTFLNFVPGCGGVPVYTPGTNNKVGEVAPNKFGGLSYKAYIYSDSKDTWVYKIKTSDFGVVDVHLQDLDSHGTNPYHWNITEKPTYPLGDADMDTNDGRDNLILRFTGLIDKVIDGVSGTITVKSRDMMKRMIETMVRPKTGEYSVAYPENPADDTWWIASDIIADLINRGGCNAIVERTMVMENGIEVPYVVPAIKFQEGKPIVDAIKEVADNINYRCWANRSGNICLSRWRWKGQKDGIDFKLSEYVDLTDLERTLDDADARGKLRVVCTYNNQAEEYMDEFLHNEVCKGEDRYASVESQWMETPEKRQVMASNMFRQMKRKYKTLSLGTIGNPFVDIGDHIEVLESVVSSVDPHRYTITGIRTTVSEKGYLDIYDLEYGSDLDKAVLVAYAWGDSDKEVGTFTDREIISWAELKKRLGD